jgi:hypothetical protein
MRLRVARLARIWLPVAFSAAAVWTRGPPAWKRGWQESRRRATGDDAPGGHPVKVRLLGFGAIEVDGREYEHDIVIERGRVRQRKKKPSKPYRNEFGHTPLSANEELPWGGSRLIIGTGAYGSLPIMPEVIEEAARRGVDLAAVPTEEACRLIARLDEREVHAVLHVTC